MGKHCTNKIECEYLDCPTAFCDRLEPEKLICANCGSATQVWKNQVSGVQMSHRVGCVVSAGDVKTSSQVYIVTNRFNHVFLEIGDRVVMCETPEGQMLLLRLEDMTLHFLTDNDSSYAQLQKELKP